jgi:hypothetical protein
MHSEAIDMFGIAGSDGADTPRTGATAPRSAEARHDEVTAWTASPRVTGEWYRLDGTLMRSGYFAAGEQAGLWGTYDKIGAACKASRYRPTSSA